jgi:hypothetical protein
VVGTHWEVFVSSLFDDEFGCARTSVAQRSEQESEVHIEPIRQHISVADRAFEIIALTLHDAVSDGESTSKRVTRNLLTQIAQDTKAVRLLASCGFPYQAATVSVSSFEHSMMIGSIGGDDTRAQKWLNHLKLKRNINNVKELVQLTLENLDRLHDGLSSRLGDLYAGIYEPLCTFKHGNPVVQQRMNPVGQLPMSIFAKADRRADIAAMWALEASVRSIWISLVSFIDHHGIKRKETDEMMRGLNEALREIVAVRKEAHE